MGNLTFLDYPKLISRKIWVTEKSWNFHAVRYKFKQYKVGNTVHSFSDIRTEENQPQTLFQTYMLVLLVIQYAIPLTIISYAYTRMGIKLWLTSTPGNADNQRDERILINKKKFIKMLLLVLLLFGICWLPWHLYHSVAVIWPSINR